MGRALLVGLAACGGCAGVGAGTPYEHAQWSYRWSSARRQESREGRAKRSATEEAGAARWEEGRGGSSLEGTRRGGEEEDGGGGGRR